MNSENAGLSVDEVTTLTKEQVERILGANNYLVNQVNQWTSTIIEQTIAQLTKLNKPYKYIVTCAIMQKVGAGLHLANACYWDNNTDVSATVRWENKTMYCIVTVHACAI